MATRPYSVLRADVDARRKQQNIESARRYVRGTPGANLRGAEGLRNVADMLDSPTEIHKPWPFTAERLRVLAEELEANDKDTTERLVKAGEDAAFAMREVERVNKLNTELLYHTRMLHEENEQLTADRQHTDDEFGTVEGERDKAIASAKVQRKVIDTLLSQMIELLAEQDNPDVEIVFSYGAHAGITPGQASDLALSLINTQAGDETV